MLCVAVFIRQPWGLTCSVAVSYCAALQDMRVVFVDGTVLDTADPNSRESFLRVSPAAAAAQAGRCSRAAQQGRHGLVMAAAAADAELANAAPAAVCYCGGGDCHHACIAGTPAGAADQQRGSRPVLRMLGQQQQCMAFLRRLQLHHCGRCLMCDCVQSLLGPLCSV